MPRRIYDISLYRCDLYIYGGSWGENVFLAGGTGFHAISGVPVFTSVLAFEAWLLQWLL